MHFGRSKAASKYAPGSPSAFADSCISWPSSARIAAQYAATLGCSVGGSDGITDSSAGSPAWLKTMFSTASGALPAPSGRERATASTPTGTKPPLP